jgi:hypothetical protein
MEQLWTALTCLVAPYGGSADRNTQLWRTELIVDYERIGGHLRNLRIDRAMTIREAVDRLADNPGAIYFGESLLERFQALSAIERGAMLPNIMQLRLIARIYGVYLEVGFRALDL